MDGFRTLDYVDVAPHQPQNATLQLPDYVEDILASAPLRGMLPDSHQAVETRYRGAMATEILLRGDGRKPEDIKAAGGFHPPRTTTGKHHINVARHTNMERAPSGSATAFISTSRSMQIALEAVKGQEKSPGNGWVYAVLARGVDVQASGTYERIPRHTGAYNAAVEAINARRDVARKIGEEDEKEANEMHKALDAELQAASARYPAADLTVYRQAEVAAVLRIPWNQVLGFREVKNDRLTGPLYLREDILRFDIVEGRVVPAFRTPGGVEVFRHLRPSRHQPKLGITLATVARLAELFQVSLDRRLQPHTKGYVVSLFPLVMNQDWGKFEQRMPHLFFFDTEAKARQSAYMRSMRSWAPAAGHAKDGGPPAARVYLYEIDVDAYRKSVVKLKIKNNTPDDADAWIRTTGQTAKLKSLLYLFRKVDSKWVAR